MNIAMSSIEQLFIKRVTANNDIYIRLAYLKIYSFEGFGKTHFFVGLISLFC